MKHRNDAGFSLVEVLVAIVILGLITVPMTSGMIVALKAMGRADEMMHSQLAVSSAVEELMASGISAQINRTEDGVTITAVKADTDLPYYNVRVESEDGSVVVETVIREAGGGE